MRTRSGAASRTAALVGATMLWLAGTAAADEIRVMTSGGFTAALIELTPAFERATGHTVVTTYGASLGGAPDSIPSRLQRGEPADLVILASEALDDLVGQGRVVPGRAGDLAPSTIGMAVRAGAPKPYISSVHALKPAPLQAKAL